jgi:hypothetical protein
MFFCSKTVTEESCYFNFLCDLASKQYFLSCVPTEIFLNMPKGSSDHRLGMIGVDSDS